MKTYHDLWVQKISDDRKSFDTILRWDVFRDWERSCAPESRAEDELILALELLYADRKSSEAQEFLRRALAVSERTTQENKLTSELCEAAFPLNRGGLLRSHAYSLALLGHELDTASLIQASSDFEGWCKHYKKGEWDSQSQAYYLAGVRLAIIAGDWERSERLLKIRKSFKWHQRQFELLKRLVEEFCLRHVDDPDYLASFDEYFDYVRDPNLNPDVFMEKHILGLELGIIRDKYLVSPDLSIDWKRIISAVSH